MRCFNVFVFCIRGIKMMHLGWKEPQYVQFLNGEEHSRVGCLCRMWPVGYGNNILFYVFLFLHLDVFVFLSFDDWLYLRQLDISVFLQCLPVWYMNSLWELTRFAFLDWCVQLFFIKLSGLAWIQNCSFLMSSKPWMKSIFPSERRSPDVCTAFQNVFPHEMLSTHRFLFLSFSQ